MLGMWDGAVLIGLYRKEPCLMTAVLWPPEMRPSCPRERLPFLLFIQARGMESRNLEMDEDR